MIELKSLCFSYGKNRVLRGISHCFKRGIFTALMGPNGCGKTTTIKNIASILSPQRGEILIEGKNLKKISLKELSRFMAYVRQKPNSLPNMTVIESVLSGRIPFMSYYETESDRKSVYKVIKELGLEHIKDKSVEEISGGELQKTLIAQALAKDPEILLLDEPLNNLDIKNQSEIMMLTAQKTVEKNMVTICVLHDLNMALRFCSEILILDKGEIVFAGKTESFTSETAKKIFKVDCEIIKKDNKIYALY